MATADMPETGERAEPAPSATPSSRRTRRRRRAWLLLRDILVIILIAVLVSWLVKTFVVRSFYIPSSSMEQTLQVQDRILVDQLTPRFTGYDRGDVVVFRDPGGWLPVVPKADRSPFAAGIDWVLSIVGLTASDSDDHLIKRVIGLPGDTVVCCNPLGQTEVNGVPIDETSYLNLTDGRRAPRPVPYEVTVPKKSVWVLGDNRDRSMDSRFHRDQPSGGFVPIDNIVGRAFLITWPFAHFGFIDGRHEVFTGVPDPGSDADDDE